MHMALTPAWFAARFVSGTEVAAARRLDGGAQEHLGELPPRAFCPVERRAWHYQGRRHEALVPVIGGYIFVQMLRYDSYRWHATAGQRGFLGFVGDPLAPSPIVAGTLVEDLIARADADWVIEWAATETGRPPLRRGDVVRLRDDIDTQIDIDSYIPVDIVPSRPISNKYTSKQTAVARAVIAPGLAGVVEYVQGLTTAWVSFRGLFDREHRLGISIAALERVDVTSKRQRATLMDLPVRA
jgi:transcription termination factor NusG